MTAIAGRRRVTLRHRRPVDRPRPAAPGDEAATPSSSLRSRWSRSLAVFLAIFTVVAVANFAATRSTSGAFRDVALRMEHDADALAHLRSDIVAAALLRSAAVQGLEQEPGRLGTAVAAERASFARAADVLQPGAGREIIERQARLSLALWPDDITTLTPVEFLARSTTGRANFAMTDEAAEASRAAARADLAAAATLERRTTVAIALTSLVLVGLMIRFARRLSNEVLRPVARLRDTANRLAAGDLDERVEVQRADEIGDLAATFNAMADVVANSHRELTREASRDGLTGLANRATFQRRLQAALERPERRDRQQAVVFVDLDDFKDVNDDLGHAAGDEVLRAVASRLTAAVRPGDLVARLGGDEFALLLDGVEDPAAALSIAERAVTALGVPVELAGSRVRVGASAGLAMRRKASDPDTLMREADVAMYAAKGQGKNRVQSFGAAPGDTAATGDPDSRVT